MTTTAIPYPTGGLAGGLGRPLRLLMEPAGQAGGNTQRCRWVQELNGHSGRCAPDHWHGSPEEALGCFRGAAADSLQPDLAAPANTTRSNC